MKKKISQIKLPAPNDRDPHPRLLVDGDGVHAGQGFRALFPDGGMISRWRYPGSPQVPGAGTSPPPAMRTCAQWVCSWRCKENGYGPYPTVPYSAGHKFLWYSKISNQYTVFYLLTPSTSCGTIPL